MIVIKRKLPNGEERFIASMNDEWVAIPLHRSTSQTTQERLHPVKSTYPPTAAKVRKDLQEINEATAMYLDAFRRPMPSEQARLEAAAVGTEEERAKWQELRHVKGRGKGTRRQRRAGR